MSTARQAISTCLGLFGLCTQKSESVSRETVLTKGCLYKTIVELQTTLPKWPKLCKFSASGHFENIDCYHKCNEE